MTIRKRNDSEGWKRGVGAYSQGVTLREGRFPDSNPGTSKRGVGAYTEDEAGLRNTLPDEQTADTRDINADVEGNQPDGGNRAVRSRGQD
jgi:hypothetical protein